MTARHESNITIRIALDAAPVPEAGFGNVVVIVPKSENSLDGERVVAFTNMSDAQDAQTSGYISASTLAAIRTALSQTPTPAQIKVGNVDLGDGETYPEALAAILSVDSDIYGVCIASRDASDIAAMITDIEARRMSFVAQSSASGIKSGSLPVGLELYATAKNTRLIFHDTNAEWADVGWLAGRLAFNPDVRSVPWSAPVAGVKPYAVGLTEAQRSAMIGINVNVGLPYGGEQFYVDAGVSGSGHPAYEILTAHWFEARLQERIARLRTSKSALGEKIPVDESGQAMVLAEVHALIDQGEAAGHFLPGARQITAPPITSTDRAARRIRVSGHTLTAGDARLFDFDLAFIR